MITNCPILFLFPTDKEYVELSTLLEALTKNDGVNDVQRINAYAQAVGAIAVRQALQQQSSVDAAQHTNSATKKTYGGVSGDGVFINGVICVTLLLVKGWPWPFLFIPIHAAMWVISRWKPDLFNIPGFIRAREKKAREARQQDMTNVVQLQLRGPGQGNGR